MNSGTLQPWKWQLTGNDCSIPRRTQWQPRARVGLKRKVFCNRSCPILLNSDNYTYYYYASDCIFGTLSTLKIKMWLNQWSQIRWMDGHCNLAMPCTHKNYTTHMFITEERRSASSSSSSCVCGAVRCRGLCVCVCVCVAPWGRRRLPALLFT